MRPARANALALVALCLLATASAWGQERSPIVAAEVFIDVDPGPGKATAVAVSAADSAVFTAALPSADVEPGWHTACVRGRDRKGVWSATRCAHIFVKEATATPATLAELMIVGGEAFLDADPGPGRASAIAVTAPADSVAVIDSLDVGDATPGFHTVCTRFVDARGTWTPTRCVPVVVREAPTDPLDSASLVITGAEYFFGPDPGQGRGVAVADLQITDARLAEGMMSVAGLPLGDTVATVRFRDARGVWTPNVTRRFSVCETFGPTADFELIYTGGVAYVTSNSTLADSLYWDFGGRGTARGRTVSFADFPPGNYEVTLTAANPCGRDTLSRKLAVAGVSAYSPRRGGTGGEVTLTFDGGGFGPAVTGAELRQVDGAGRVAADTVYGPADGRQLLAVFTLPEVLPKGDYEVVILRNAAPAELEAPGTFRVETPTEAAPTARLVGRAGVRPGRWSTFELTVDNPGNRDLHGVPVFLALEDAGGEPVEVDLLFDLLVDGDDRGFDTIAPWVPIDSLHGEAFSGRVYGFFMPEVIAGASADLRLRLRASPSAGDFRTAAWATAPFYGSPVSPEALGCLDGLSNVLLDLADLSPAGGCLRSLWDELVTPKIDVSIRAERAALANSGSATKKVVTYTYSTAKVIGECVTAANPASNAVVTGLRIAKKLVKFASDVETVTGYVETAENCTDYFFPEEPPTPQTLPVRRSFDPNEITGPVGAGAERWVSEQGLSGYRVSFENVDTAAAPAQEVIVTDTLDLARYRASSFAFGRVTVAGTSHTPAPGLQAFAHDFDRRPAEQLIVRVTGDFDPVTGVARWHFLSLDPATMDFTEDPDLGVVYPNVDPPEGDGSVDFVVAFRDDLSTGDRVDNRASIVFDFNAPILTNTWSNAVDEVAPASSLVLGARGVVADSIWLRPEGVDVHAGLGRIEYFVRRPGVDSFELWRATNGPRQVAYVARQLGDHDFAARAVDRAGNAERKTLTAEVTAAPTKLSALPEAAAAIGLELSPNPAGRVVTVGVGEGAGLRSVEIHDALGRLVLRREGLGGARRVPIDLSELALGTYAVSVEADGTTATRTLVVR